MIYFPTFLLFLPSKGIFMLHYLQAAARALETGLRIVCKLMFILPLIAAMVLFNFKVDRSGIFQGDRYQKEMAQALIDGRHLSHYDQLDERTLYATLAEIVEEPYQTIALGSSRVLQLRQEAIQEDSYLDCGMSNADYRDMMTTFYLFDRADMLPENMILCLDPGILYDSPDMLHPYADDTLFKEFLTTSLGIATDYQPPDTSGRWRALVSPSYLQGNVKYFFRDTSQDRTPAVVDEDSLYLQAENVKLGDGSVLYGMDYRGADIAEVEQRVREDLHTFSRLQGFKGPDDKLAGLFDQFIQSAQGKGVNIIFLLVPYHPMSFNYLVEHRHLHPGFFQMEQWYRDYAVRNGIAMYGSYNPYIDDFTEADFYDGLHIKPEALERIFPGMKQAVKDGQSASPTNPSPHGGKRVNSTTASRLVKQKYEIKAPEVLRRGGSVIIDKESCYEFLRYADSDDDAVLLARYAVSKSEGIVYRMDTEINDWVLDMQFPEPII